MPSKRRSNIGRRTRKAASIAKARRNQSDEKRASQNELKRQQMSRARMMQTQEERAACNYRDKLRMRRYRERRAVCPHHYKALKFTNKTPGLQSVSSNFTLPALNLMFGTAGVSTDFLKNIQKHASCYQMPSFGAKHVEESFMPTFQLKIIKKAKLLASETPEETKARLLRQSEKSARLRRERHASETPEQRNARLLREQEYNRNYRLKRKQMRQAMENDLELKSAKLTNATLSKLPKIESTDDDLIGSCSSFEASEGSYSYTTTDVCSSTTDETPTDKSVKVKNEPWSWNESETSHSNFDTDVKSRTDNMVYDIKYERDEHSEYGEYVADRFRKSNRNRREINVAKKLIDNVMLNLSIGRCRLKDFTETNVYDKKVQAPSLAMLNATQTVVQDIIVKEEIDLFYDK